MLMLGVHGRLFYRRAEQQLNVVGLLALAL